MDRKVVQRWSEDPEQNPFAGMKKLYDSALKDDWESVIQHFEKNKGQLLTAMTLDRDSVLHIAASQCQRGKDVLERLLNLLATDDLKREAMETCNCHGNSVLHEVTVSGNPEAAEFLLDGFYVDPEERRKYGVRLLRIRNELGETPVYRSSSFGKTNLVKLFCPRVEMNDLHFHRKVDDVSILHIAVLSQHFDTALYLLTNYGDSLGQRREDKGLTSLQLLAQMPLAFKPKFYKNKWIKTLIYNCLPDEDDLDVPPNQKDDVEISSTGRNQPHQSFSWKRLSVFRKYVSTHMWNSRAKEWPLIDMIRCEKKDKKSLRKLIQLLVEKDFSWKKSNQSEETEKNMTVDLGIIVESFGTHRGGKEMGSSENVTAEGKEKNAAEADKQLSIEEKKRITINKSKRFTPLLLATSRGAVRIVEEILEVHPQAIEHINEDGRNILHFAIMYRQYDIFKFLKSKPRILSRLIQRIDSEGNTILHQASDSRHHNTADQRLKGPAMQLQDELHWVERAQEIIPPHYTLHHNKSNDTAVDLFNQEHKELLKSAQGWIKDTAQACTVVGVLVATLVFAAAYTVPGGTDPDTGLPVFRNSPFFWVFTIMDISSLVSSLASVVMFLSILSSPLEYPDFRHSLPRKLKFGFAFLFLSLIFTMLAFCSTIFLLIHDLQNKWTRTLVYTIALLPVTVLGLMQFPLHHALHESIKSIYKKTIRKDFPHRVRENRDN